MALSLQNLIKENEQLSLICITGPMAAGKNFVCSQFEQNGWLSLDADKQVHKAIEKATPQIINAFGEMAEKCGIKLENPDGTLNRRALGALLFPNPDLLAKQESIVYPILIEETTQFIHSNSDKKIILNATVLYKIPELLNMCQKIIFVTAPLPVRFNRALKRDKMPALQILRRFHTQRNLLKEYKKSGISLQIFKNY